MSRGETILLLSLPVVAAFIGWFATSSEAFVLIIFLALTLTMLGAVWGGGGRLTIKVDAGRLTVTHERPWWRRAWGLPVTMERPVFEVRQYGRHKHVGLLVATEHGKDTVMLVHRARVEVVEQLQRELTAYYAAR